MLNDLFRTIKACLVAAGILLSFFAVLELIRAFETLYNLHPAAGYVFLLILLVGSAWLFLWFFGILSQNPKALRPPTANGIEQADSKHLGRWMGYQQSFMLRLLANPLLDETARRHIQAGIDTLSAAQRKDSASVLAAILTAERDTIDPALASLDKHAARQIRDCVRDVMLGVTLSPYKSADLFIVLYRNILMVGRIIQTYNTRPTLANSLRIGMDILNIVATVNFINLGKNLIEALTSRLPGVGKLTDDIAQGIGAGFLTSVAGHAAMDRCRAFRAWNPQQARAGLLANVGGFYADVRDIFFTDIWGFVRAHSAQATDGVRDAIGQAIDQTAQTLGQCIRIPAKAAIATGQTLVDTTASSAKSIKDILLKPFRK